MSKPVFELTGDIDLDFLLEKINNGADIDFKDVGGNTALIISSSYGYIDICKLLLENGADMNIQNNFWNTALMRASYSGHIEICKLLVENGANLYIQNIYENMAIDIMKEKGIYNEVNPYKIIGLKYFQEVFKEHAEDYMDIFETTLYSQDLELDDIKANINMFYSTVLTRMENNTINENLEL